MKIISKYCYNCEVELTGNVTKFERSDGSVLDFCSKECKDQSIQFWRYKGLDIVEIKNPKDIKMFSKV